MTDREGAWSLTTDPESLLAEAAASVQSDSDADVLSEAAEILTAERARVCWEDRWQAMAGTVLLACQPGPDITGTVLSIGPDLVVVADRDETEHAVAWTSVMRVAGLPLVLHPELIGHGARDGEGPTGRLQSIRGLSWSRWLRASRDVRVTCVDGWQAQGCVLTVGADHLDLGVREGLADERMSVWAIPFRSLARVSRRRDCG
jgi:hypothetical protein